MSRDGTPGSSSSDSNDSVSFGDILETQAWLDKTPPSAKKVLHVAHEYRDRSRAQKPPCTTVVPKELVGDLRKIHHRVRKSLGDKHSVDRALRLAKRAQEVKHAEMSLDSGSKSASGEQAPSSEKPAVDKNQTDTEQSVVTLVEGDQNTSTTDGAFKDDEDLAKAEELLEKKIDELPQEDRPEECLVFESKGRVPSHENELHVIPPNLAHEGHQSDTFYGGENREQQQHFAKDTKCWVGWAHTDPKRSYVTCFVTCEQPFWIEEISEYCYTVQYDDLQDNETREYYEKCLVPQSRLFLHHPTNRLQKDPRMRVRVNPTNWTDDPDIPPVKELPRGSIIVRNEMCFKILSHIEHVSGVFAQLCDENGVVIGGKADADILHYETDFNKLEPDTTALLKKSIAVAKVHKSKVVQVSGQIDRLERRRKRKRQPYKKVELHSDIKSKYKTESAFSGSGVPLVEVERSMAKFKKGGGGGPKSSARSDASNTSKPNKKKPKLVNEESTPPVASSAEPVVSGTNVHQPQQAASHASFGLSAPALSSPGAAPNTAIRPPGQLLPPAQFPPTQMPMPHQFTPVLPPLPQTPSSDVIQGTEVATLRQENSEIKSQLSGVMQLLQQLQFQQQQKAAAPEPRTLTQQEERVVQEEAMLQFYKDEKEKADREREQALKRVEVLTATLTNQRERVAETQAAMQMAIAKTRTEVEKEFNSRNSEEVAKLRGNLETQQLRGIAQDNEVKRLMAELRALQQDRLHTQDLLSASRLQAMSSAQRSAIPASVVPQPPDGAPLTEQYIKSETGVEVPPATKAESKKQEQEAETQGETSTATLHNLLSNLNAEHESRHPTVEVDDDIIELENEEGEPNPDPVASKVARSPRHGVQVKLGRGHLYYDKAGHAFYPTDVYHATAGLTIIPSAMSKNYLSQAAMRQYIDTQEEELERERRLEDTVSNVAGGQDPPNSNLSARDAKRSLFPTSDDKHKFQTGPDSESDSEEQRYTYFPAPIEDSGVISVRTLQDDIFDNETNAKRERTEILHKMQISVQEQKQKDKAAKIINSAFVNLRMEHGMREMEESIALATLRCRIQREARAAANSELDNDIAEKQRELQRLNDLENEMQQEKDAQALRIAQAELKEIELKQEADRKKKAEEERKRLEAEEKQRKDEAAAQRRIKLELQRVAARKLAEEAAKKERERKRAEARKKKEEKKAVTQKLFHNEREFEEREKAKKKKLDDDHHLAMLKSKLRKELEEEMRRESSPASSLSSVGSAKGGRKHRISDSDSDVEVNPNPKKKAKLSVQANLDNMIAAKKAELEALRKKLNDPNSGAKSNLEPLKAQDVASKPKPAKAKYRGTTIPAVGYVAPTVDPPFEVARRYGVVENKHTFLVTADAWRWAWPEFSTITVKTVERASVEKHNVNVAEFQAMQLAAGFAVANLHRMPGFATRDLAYGTVRAATNAVRALPEGNMRRVRGVIEDRELRDILVQTALMTEVPNSPDYRTVALKQLEHIRSQLATYYHALARKAKKAGEAKPTGGGDEGQSDHDSVK